MTTRKRLESYEVLAFSALTALALTLAGLLLNVGFQSPVIG
jgi:hypothetical protein